MPIITKKPVSDAGAGANGVWTMTPSTGSSVHAILSDGNNATFLSSTTRAQIPSQFAVFDIEDVTLPAGAKIYAVRQRVTVLQQLAPSGSSFLDNIIRFYGQFVQEVVEDAVTGQIPNLIASIFAFLWPIKPTGAGSATWQTVELAYNPEKPSGGEWTLDVFNALTWRLGRSDNSGQLAKVSEFFVDLEYNERPTVDVIAPATDISTTTRPVIGFDYDDPEGDPQVKFQVKIFDEATYTAVGFDPETSTPLTQSGWVPGSATQWLCNVDLQNGNYRAAVQVAQVWKGIGDHVSLWDTIDWAQDVPQPPVPLITATPNNIVNWVQIQLQPSDLDPATESYNVYYSDNNGLTYDMLRKGFQVQANPVDGTATLYDYEAPLTKFRQYIAKGYRTLEGGTVKVASDPSEPAIAQPGADGWWVKDPLAPSRNMRIRVTNDEYNRQRSGSVQRPLVAQGSTGYVQVNNGAAWGKEGTLEITFVGEDDESGYNQFVDIYLSGHTVLLQYPTGEQRWVRFGMKLGEQWKPRWSKVRYRRGNVDYYEQVRPSDPTVPANA